MAYPLMKDANNFKYAIESYASWGFFDFRRKDESDMKIGYQSVPVDWGINHERKQQFFEYVKEITGEQLACGVPQAGWRNLLVYLGCVFIDSKIVT